jgi:hypothetical protein
MICGDSYVQPLRINELMRNNIELQPRPVSRVALLDMLREMHDA